MTDTPQLLALVYGASAMGLGVAGLFFLRFYRDTRDRLFGILSAAFSVLAVHFLVLGLVQPGDETRHYVYLIRLLAFLLIIAGVVDKSRAER